MKLEVLMSCMHQHDDTLVKASRLTGDVLVVNQCNREGYAEYPTPRGTTKMYSTCQRGLTKSRNMALAHSDADICLLCDDDEIFVENYAQAITDAYQALPQADVLIFKMVDRASAFPDRTFPLRFLHLMQVCSWQISFRRQRLVDAGIRFDELLGAGSGNGAEEELKFLLDCRKAGLKIYYTPVPIASVKQEHSTWYDGFTETFFENRGATTRYILGPLLAGIYGVYYVVFKRTLYKSHIAALTALRAVFRGIRQNKIGKAAKVLAGAAENEVSN